MWRKEINGGSSGLLSTAGGVLFLSNGQNVEAWDAATGKGLWYSQIGGLGAPAETFMLDGKQHVLFSAGGGTLHVRAQLVNPGSAGAARSWIADVLIRDGWNLVRKEPLMATAINPTTFSIEKWMNVPIGSTSLFTFSGFAQFVWGQNPMYGTGGNDTEEQKTWVEYAVTLIVGPHWQAVRQMCPLVVASGYDQLSPDEADALGYEVTAINKVTLVKQNPQDTFFRIKIQLSTKVRGGNNIDAYGLIPALAYKVTAFGVLADPIGSEGVFFGNAIF